MPHPARASRELGSRSSVLPPSWYFVCPVPVVQSRPLRPVACGHGQLWPPPYCESSVALASLISCWHPLNTGMTCHVCSRVQPRAACLGNPPAWEICLSPDVAHVAHCTRLRHTHICYCSQGQPMCTHVPTATRPSRPRARGIPQQVATVYTKLLDLFQASLTGMGYRINKRLPLSCGSWCTVRERRPHTHTHTHGNPNCPRHVIWQ